MFIIYIVLPFRWQSVSFFFFHTWRREKIPEFFTAIFGPKLHVIIINNYWTKDNIDKIIRQLKDTQALEFYFLEKRV